MSPAAPPPLIRCFPRRAARTAWAVAAFVVVLASGGTARADEPVTLTPPYVLVTFSQSASLAAAGLPPSASVTLTARAGTTWSPVTSTTSTSGGAIEVTVAPARTTAYRLAWSVESSGTSSPVVLVSSIATVAVRPRVSFRALAGGAPFGDFVAGLPGMAPRFPAATLRVERYLGRGRWRTLERTTPGRPWRFPADRRGVSRFRFRWLGDARLERADVVVTARVWDRRGRGDVLRSALLRGFAAGVMSVARYRARWADVGEGERGLARMHRQGRLVVAREAATSLMQAGAYARARRLTPERAGVLSHQLAANARYFAGHGMPGSVKVKLSVRGSALVWAYFPGQGVQFHPVDSLHRARLHLRHRAYGAAKAIMDELLDMQVRRRAAGRSFLVSEYGFEYEGHPAPWVSGMAEGLKVEVLGALSRRLSDRAAQKRYLAAAHETLPVFDVSWRSGGVMDTDGHRGRWYLEYAYWDRQRVLNGFMFALLGLDRFARDSVLSGAADARTRADARRARVLFEQGVLELVRHLPAYDLGDWSRYAEGGEAASAVYHRIHVMFLQQIADATANRRAAAVCRAYARKWGGGRRSAGATALGAVPQDAPRLYVEEEWLEKMTLP